MLLAKKLDNYRPNTEDRFLRRAAIIRFQRPGAACPQSGSAHGSVKAASKHTFLTGKLLGCHGL